MLLSEVSDLQSVHWFHINFFSSVFCVKYCCRLQVVSVDESGRQQPGCYGSQVRSGEQSLSRPLSLYHAGDENHILVTDYYQHRVHLVTHQMQFVRHLVTAAEAPTIGHDRGITYPRHICLNDGFLYVGTHSGVIGIYRVQ